MRARVWYILLSLAAAILYLWSNVQQALLLLMLILLAAPAAILENWLASKYLKVSVRLEKGGSRPEPGTQGDLADGDGHPADAVVMTIEVQNRSYLPAFRVQPAAVVKNRLTGSVYQIPFETAVAPRHTASRQIVLESLYCGRIEAEVTEAWAVDFLGLSKRKVMARSRGGCYAYPQAEEIPAGEIGRHQQEEQHTEERYTHKKGNDITEILNIRDYQKGDNIKTIHWKLSKKLGHKVVKELDMPASQDVILLMALSHDSAQAEEPRHKVAQMTLNISEMLLQEQIFYDAVLLRDGGSTVGLYTIQEQKARDWYEQLLLDGNVEFDQDYVEKYIAYHHILGRYASVILVTDRMLEGWFEGHPQVIQIIAA